MKILIQKKGFMKNKRKYYSNHFKNLPLENQRRIYNLISRGFTIYQIIKLEKVSVSSLHLLFDEIQKPVSRGKIGYRNEAYWTEEFMINGYIQPLFEDLSLEEQKIYNRI